MASNAARQQLLREIKSRLTGDIIIQRYAPGTDLRSASDGINYKVKCFLPGHSDNTPSLCIGINNFKYICFGGCPCPNSKGDFLELIKTMENCNFSKAYDVASEMCGLTLDNEAVVESKTKKPPKKVAKKKKKAIERPPLDESIAIDFHQRLLSEDSKVFSFTDERAITLHQVTEYKLGIDNFGNFTIPIYEDGALVNVKYRNRERNPKLRPGQKRKPPKYWSHSTKNEKKETVHRYGEQRLFNKDRLSDTAITAVVICGGEYDAIVASGLHPAILGIASTTGEDSWEPLWGNLLQERDVFICLDNDDAGKLGTQKILSHMPDAKVIDLSAYVSSKGDVSEFVKAKGSQAFKMLLEDAIKTGRSGYDDEVINSVTENQVMAVNPAYCITADGDVYITGMFERDKVVEKREGKTTVIKEYKTQEPMIISSKRELLEVPRVDPEIKQLDPFAVATFNGWAVKQEPQNAQRIWCGADVKRYIKGGKLYSDAKKSFMDIYEGVKKYAHFTRKTYRGLVSVYIMGSYFYEGFASYPYLLLHGEKGSGKSTLAQYIASVAFNAEFMVSPTLAVLARKIEESKGLVVIDEAESLSKRDQGRSPIGQVLNSGYQKGASRSICNPDDGNKTVQFDLYCPKVICNIYGLNDVLKSRCIALSTQKVQGIILKMGDPRDDPGLRKVAKNMYELLFSKCKEVMKAYAEVKAMDEFAPIERKTKTLAVFGRTRELFIPMFTIAKFIYNESGYAEPWDHMLEELHHIAGEKDQDEEETPEEMLKDAIIYLVNGSGGDAMELTIHEIVEEYRLRHLSHKDNIDMWVVKAIKKYGWAIKEPKARRGFFECKIATKDSMIISKKKKLTIYTFTRELLKMDPLPGFREGKLRTFLMDAPRDYLKKFSSGGRRERKVLPDNTKKDKISIPF